MAFEGLSEKLNATFKRLRGKGRLSENDVREAMREVRLALLEADVSFKVVKEFEKWGLKFTSFDSNFGKLLVMHHELMDKNEKSNEILVIDPEYLRKKHFMTWDRKEYDMAKLAKRDTRAVVMKEASCCYLVYPNAHAIVKLGELA
jgi:hypothetical protein